MIPLLDCRFTPICITYSNEYLSELVSKRTFLYWHRVPFSVYISVIMFVIGSNDEGNGYTSRINMRFRATHPVQGSFTQGFGPIKVV